MARKRKRKLKKWVYVLISLIIIFLVVVVLLAVFKLGFNRDLTLVKNLEFELGSSLKVADLIKDSEVNIINLEDEIDTSFLGEQDVVIEYQKNGELVDYEVSIDIVDREKPVIKVEDVVTVSINTDNKIEELVEVMDNSKESIEPVISGSYDLTKEGEYEIVIKATDRTGNSSSKRIKLKVLQDVSYNEDGSLKDGEYATSKGYTLVVKDGVATVDGVLIVNKTYSLPSTYESKSPYKAIDRVRGYCTDCIEDFVMEAFLELEEDAKELGLSLRINSGLRTYNTQKWLYNSYVNRDGKEEADTYSARAGHSEHQSGLCFDLNSTNSSFTNTKEGKWVNDNCYKYGFVIRFPDGKEKYTGYNYESWHLRYVGKELAEKLYNNGDWISLEEYYGLTSEYPN